MQAARADGGQNIEALEFFESWNGSAVCDRNSGTGTSWAGVTCGSTGHVLRIDLYLINISGTSDSFFCERVARTSTHHCGAGIVRVAGRCMRAR